ncbi:hypothetical protein L2X98_33575 [Microbacterium elymi]|uniref:Uncharacterized protein n=1 Tax=Microbacterium elymi TaxID=2909587 RepID=A0ABY5NJ38_9MICO|nr:hypothetical protein [Microbacterium elymi]UUT35177.1 hypothetical protein L2X98_33575 [Microbacterium elymi]
MSGGDTFVGTIDPSRCRRWTVANRVRMAGVTSNEVEVMPQGA